MKLVIEIDEEDYNIMKHNITAGNPLCPLSQEEMVSKVANGIPLPKESRIGHWIYDDEYSDWFDVTYKCSCCKRVIIVLYDARNEVYKDYPYCHCGAKMIETQESEDKE